MHPTFQVADIGGEQSVRVAVIPFEQANQKRFLAVAIPTFGTNRVLDTFGRIVSDFVSHQPVAHGRDLHDYVGRKPRSNHGPDSARRFHGQAGHPKPGILGAAAGYHAA